MSTTNQTQTDETEIEIRQIRASMKLDFELRIQQACGGLAVVPTSRPVGDVQLYSHEIEAMNRLGYKLRFVGSWNEHKNPVFYFKKVE